MMTLRMSPTSPYVRKVRALLIEKNMDGEVAMAPVDAHASPEALTRANPLSKIPVLEREDGTVLYDSPVICEYLDSLTEAPRLYPPMGPERWQVLRRQALADGIMDAQVLRLMERRWHPEGTISQGWLDRQKAAITRALDALEAEAGSFRQDAPTMGELAIGCALGYLDFRAPDDAWRDGRPALASWFEVFAVRPAIAETAPPADAPLPGG